MDAIARRKKDHEETELFKTSRELFTTAELAERGASLEAIRAEQLTHATPERDPVER